MASCGIFFFCFFSAIWIASGNAQNVFVTVQCTAENVGQYGHQSMLECVIQTGKEVSDPEIRVVTWKKNGNPLLVFNKGDLKYQQPGYKFAEPSWDKKNMNISLLITNTRVADLGDFSCVVFTDSGNDEGHTSLKVTAKYSAPTIHSIPEKIIPNQDSTLICKSTGGYPQGQLRWFDIHNDEWTQSSKMEVTQTDSGLYELSSSLSLLHGSTFSQYTCIVFNASGDKEDETTFELPPTFHEQGSNEASITTSKIVAPVVVIGSLIVGLLLLLLYRRRTHQARRLSAAPLMDHHHEVRTSEANVEEGDHYEKEKQCQFNLA